MKQQQLALISKITGLTVIKKRGWSLNLISGWSFKFCFWCIFGRVYGPCINLLVKLYCRPGKCYHIYIIYVITLTCSGMMKTSPSAEMSVASSLDRPHVTGRLMNVSNPQCVQLLFWRWKSETLFSFPVLQQMAGLVIAGSQSHSVTEWAGEQHPTPSAEHCQCHSWFCCYCQNWTMHPAIKLNHNSSFPVAATEPVICLSSSSTGIMILHLINNKCV